MKLTISHQNPDLCQGTDPILQWQRHFRFAKSGYTFLWNVPVVHIRKRDKPILCRGKKKEKNLQRSYKSILTQWYSVCLKTFAQRCRTVLADLRCKLCILGDILCEGRCYLQLLDSRFVVAPDSITSVGLFMCNVWTGSAFISMVKSSLTHRPGSQEKDRRCT